MSRLRMSRYTTDYITSLDPSVMVRILDTNEVSILTRVPQNFSVQLFLSVTITHLTPRRPPSQPAYPPTGVRLRRTASRSPGPPVCGRRAGPIVDPGPRPIAASPLSSLGPISDAPAESRTRRSPGPSGASPPTAHSLSSPSSPNAKARPCARIVVVGAPSPDRS